MWWGSTIILKQIMELLLLVLPLLSFSHPLFFAFILFSQINVIRQNGKQVTFDRSTAERMALCSPTQHKKVYTKLTVSKEAGDTTTSLVSDTCHTDGYYVTVSTVDGIINRELETSETPCYSTLYSRNWSLFLLCRRLLNGPSRPFGLSRHNFPFQELV